LILQRWEAEEVVVEERCELFVVWVVVAAVE
jgi:hypothetical protein